MPMPSVRHLAILFTIVATAAPFSCERDDCRDATEAMREQIDNVCREKAYVDTAFCTTCVPAGFFNIDESCTCQPLTFDADQCLYDDTDDSTPLVRAALDHARAVCVGRPACLPDDVECRASRSDGGGGAGGGSTSTTSTSTNVSTSVTTTTTTTTTSVSTTTTGSGGGGGTGGSP